MKKSVSEKLVGRRKRTWVGGGDDGDAGEVAGSGDPGLALVVAVHGIGGMGLNGVGQVTEAVALDRRAVGARAASVVQRDLQRRIHRVASRYAPCGALRPNTHYRRPSSAAY